MKVKVKGKGYMEVYWGKTSTAMEK